ncbi:hypothetical protein CLOM_g20293 [Closterium sp. NIES-68]|nr:hypothetical protein CLOM_g20293 [Closterium sp. NIES-68]GJP62171.1 hypothetical protein CLOP_g19263 [Closterium sp. NIES-67]
MGPAAASKRAPVASLVLLSAVFGVLCVAQIASAYTGYEQMTGKLKKKNYSVALAAWEISGLNNTLRQYLPSSQMTVLVPSNSAFGKLKGSLQYTKIRKNPKLLLQIVSYHVLKKRFFNADFQTLPVKTQFSTIDYKYTLAKSGDKPATFNKPGAGGGLKIVDPAIYVDKQVVVHGVDTVVIPPKLH